MRTLKPSFEANCLFGWLNVNLGMTLTSYNLIVEEKGWVAALSLGNFEVYIDQCAGKNPRWFSKKLINEFFELVFSLKNRATAAIAEDNFGARRFVESIGFREEGELRKAFDGSKNTVIYGFLKEDWENSKFRRHSWEAE